MIKVIATDMDGTFLDDKGSYDRQRFEKLFLKLKERGIRFVVASGNHMDRLAMIFDGMVDEMSYVAENGSHVLEGREELIKHQLSQSDARACIAYFEGKHRDYRMILSTETHSYMIEGASFQPDEFMIDEEQFQAFLSRITFIDSFDHLPQNESIRKIGMLFPVAESDRLIEQFNTHFSGGLTAVTSGYGSVDMISSGIHKAWGLEHLLRRWNVSPEDVMAFGDGENDIELLKLAKYSYAMANAPESVKKAARFIAPNHNEQGVLEVIEKVIGESC